MHELLADRLADRQRLTRSEGMAKRKQAARINLLSVREVMTARDGDISDGGGLLLRCSHETAAWVFRYTAPNGKRREMGLGACSRQSAQAAGASLTQARDLAAQARAMLASLPPVDPIDERGRARQAAKEAEAQRRIVQQSTTTLARYARAYHERVVEPVRSNKFSADWIRSLENHVPAQLWHKPVAEISRAEILDLLRDLQNRMADTAIRVRRRLDEIFDDAIERDLVAVNPVSAVRAKLKKQSVPRRSTPRPSLPFDALPAFLGHLQEQPGIASRALEFTIVTAARTGETIGATWSEFDLDRALWVIPAKRMKAGEEHRVHLSDRALVILRQQQTAGSCYVFPSAADLTRPMSNMAMLALLKRMGRSDVTVHGFRSTFSTWANETGAARPDVIEACLAHREGDKIRAAYNRALFATERRQLLDAWGAYVMGETPAGNVVALPSRAA
ncbi:MAG: tyrosine-type recombinase/integrase [Burkholderiales bacterium]|nr:tyrosine-type recombinase/integrase [Burkholderiales bacterium]